MQRGEQTEADREAMSANGNELLPPDDTIWKERDTLKSAMVGAVLQQRRFRSPGARVPRSVGATYTRIHTTPVGVHTRTCSSTARSSDQARPTSGSVVNVEKGT